MLSGCLEADDVMFPVALGLVIIQVSASYLNKYDHIGWGTQISRAKNGRGFAIRQAR
jgi:hypothetical protein